MGKKIVLLPIKIEMMIELTKMGIKSINNYR